jgi:hypothetical protein
MSSQRTRRQQLNRRRKSLFKKAAEYHRDFEADVFLVVRIKPAGKVFLLDTSPDSNPPLSKTEFVSEVSNSLIPSRLTCIGWLLSNSYTALSRPLFE